MRQFALLGLAHSTRYYQPARLLSYVVSCTMRAFPGASSGFANCVRTHRHLLSTAAG